VGTLEASRLAFGRTNQLAFELNGAKGSLAYDLERFDELLVSDGGAYRQLLVTGDWWPPGHGLGYGDTFTLELEHLVRAIAGQTTVAPLGASFEDGYRACEVADAIARASELGTRVDVHYRRVER
jgi:predicted dehydrogenase